MAAELRKSREVAEQMMQELAHAKLEYAESMAVVEQKKMESRQLHLREAQAVRELDAARSYISLLEQRLSECQMEKLSCPHCSQKLGQKEGGDPSSSDVLFSHLRAMWNSQVAMPTGGSPSRTARCGPTWT
jgi:prefoldin subunit 5